MIVFLYSFIVSLYFVASIAGFILELALKERLDGANFTLHLAVSTALVIVMIFTLGGS